MPMQTGFPASSHTSLSVASTRDGKDVGLSEEVDAVSLEEEPPTILCLPKKLLLFSPRRQLRPRRSASIARSFDIDTHIHGAIAALPKNPGLPSSALPPLLHPLLHLQLAHHATYSPPIPS